MWELDYKKSWAQKNWWLLNCGLGEDSWESLGLQGDPTSPSWRRSVLGVHWKDWCWSWHSNTLDTWCKELTHWKRPWCWERLKARGEGDSIGWDGWMASLTQWTWVSRNWGWTGRPGVLQSMGLKRVGHDWATELNWIVLSDLMHVLYHMQCLKQLKSSILCHQFATTWLFVVSLLLYVSVYVFNRLYAFIFSNHKITWVDTYRELNYSIVSQVVWKCFNIMSRRMPYVNQRQDTKNQQY